MKRRIRNSILAAVCAAALLGTGGCRQAKGQDRGKIMTFRLSPSTEGVENFKKLQGDFQSGYPADACYNVTPREIAEQYGFEIYKYDQSSASFLLYDQTVYQLGLCHGGFGVTSFAIADLNRDGAAELYYTYSWGSGIHRSQAGYFDPAARKTIDFDFVNWNRESVLTAGPNQTIFVNDADYRAGSFVDIKLTAGKQLAVIQADDGAITLVKQQ